MSEYLLQILCDKSDFFSCFSWEKMPDFFMQIFSEGEMLKTVFKKKIRTLFYRLYPKYWPA